MTGGGRGIGAGIARALAGDGWDVIVGARTRAQVETVADEIGGGWVEMDVADPRSVEGASGEGGARSTWFAANAGIATAGADETRRPSIKQGAFAGALLLRASLTSRSPPSRPPGALAGAGAKGLRRSFAAR